MCPTCAPWGTPDDRGAAQLVALAGSTPTDSGFSLLRLGGEDPAAVGVGEVAAAGAGEVGAEYEDSRVGITLSELHPGS